MKIEEIMEKEIKRMVELEMFRIRAGNREKMEGWRKRVEGVEESLQNHIMYPHPYGSNAPIIRADWKERVRDAHRKYRNGITEMITNEELMREPSNHGKPWSDAQENRLVASIANLMRYYSDDMRRKPSSILFRIAQIAKKTGIEV